MTPYAPRLVPPVGERDHVQGPATAPFSLLEYGDYECPFCGAAQVEVKDVRRRLRDKLRFAFRCFPLVDLHPHAERAAEAAEAAAAQGRFWQMHDRLFTHQDALEEEDLLVDAEAIGLDGVRFAREIASGLYAPRVADEFESGVRSGVRGTPTFFINGMRHHGPYDADSLIAVIQLGREAA